MTVKNGNATQTMDWKQNAKGWWLEDSDGSLGCMYTGWHQIDGGWYYFNEVSDGTKGALLTNTTTPDGYKVGADGKWIP